MSNSTLIIGMSGSGKSSSIRTLDSAETFIIQSQEKHLPFKYQQNYTPLVKDDKGDFTGNMLAVTSYTGIIKTLNFISESYLHIKTIVLDDFQFVATSEFMSRAKETGWEKFTDFSLHAFQILMCSSKLRSDLDVFVLSHSDYDADAKIWKIKTVGKMLDRHVSIEGLNIVLLHALYTDEGYKFLTNRTQIHLAKSPIGMFEEKFIDNDLQFVKDKMEEYWHV